MSNEITLNAEMRSNTGKGASRRLRKELKVPAIVYGGKGEPQMLTIAYKELVKALENESFYTQVISLSVDGKAQKAVLRDLQRHPARGEPTHADFQRVDAKQKIHTLVPLRFINEDKCVGVKEQGGEIQHNTADVEVISLPKDIPSFIEVDMTDVKMGQIVHLSGLKLPKGVEILALSHGTDTDHDQPVAAVHKPKGMSSDDVAEAEAAEAAAAAADTAKKEEPKKADAKKEG